MPRMLYEYLYVNLWILLVLAIMWGHDHYISVYEGLTLIVLSITGLVFVARRQLPASFLNKGNPLDS